MEFFAGSVTSARGYLAGNAIAGIKDSGAPDLALLISETPASVGAVFTTHALPSPSVTVNRERIPQSGARGVIVNSGNANASTGKQGRADAEEMAALLAGRLGVPESGVLVCSTGVIGVLLPMDKIRAAAPKVEIASDGGHSFARGIMTTDTVQKEAAVRVAIDGVEVVIGGCCKGAGMIHPNMATMLAFVTTDAAVEAEFLQQAVQRAAAASFNMIDIDGDMSTNDTLMVFANGAAGGPVISGGESGEKLEAALTAVCQQLAQKIVRDAEGATILIEVQVDSAPDLGSARKVAREIAQSLMVKTAVHGHDPNWGRIMASAGQVGVPLDADTIEIRVGPYVVYTNGGPATYDHAGAVEYLKQETVTLSMSLGSGDASATAWGCNLSEEYVRLNSVYTT